jgi:hypothetical protein
MANTKSNSLHVNAVPERRMTRTALRRLYAKLEPMTQLDLFVDRDCVAYQAREQLCRADRMAEAAGLKLLPLIRKRK